MFLETVFLGVAAKTVFLGVVLRNTAKTVFLKTVFLGVAAKAVIYGQTKTFVFHYAATSLA